MSNITTSSVGPNLVYETCMKEAYLELNQLLGGNVNSLTLAAGGNLTIGVGGLIIESFVDSITAHAGGTQASAFQLTGEINRVTTVASTNDSVALPLAQAGLDIVVINAGTKNLAVYGAGTDTINGVATATGVVQMPNSIVLYACSTSAAAGKWFAEGIGGGFSNGLATFIPTDAISAAGTSQATGTQLTALINTVATAAANTGVNLPASAAGLEVTVINNGANPLQVYPLIGATDTINGVAATVGVSIFQGTTAVFNCTLAGAWTVQGASTKTAVMNTNSNASGAITLTAAQVTGASNLVVCELTGAQSGGVNATLPIVTTVTPLLHCPTVGTSYMLRMVNVGSTQVITLTTASGWTLTGTLTIANNTWRDFVVTVATLTTMTAASVATGTYS